MVNQVTSNCKLLFPSFSVSVREISGGSSLTEPESETTTEAETQQTTLLEQEKLNNVLFVGLFVFLGIIAGLIAGKILWDRLHQ